MIEQATMVSVGDFNDAAENPDGFDWFVKYDGWNHGDPLKVTFYNDECGLDERFWLFGFEYGPTHLIHTHGHESTAWGIWLDLLPPVPMDELHEAYGSFNKLLERMTHRGYENTQQLRGFCNRWAEAYFDWDTRRDSAWDDWELEEGYEYQPNATDSGVVYTGHYDWMQEIEASDVFFRRK